MFRLLHLRRFREHRLRTVLSLAGIAIGTALAVAVLGFLGSLTGSVERFVEQASGTADLVVSASSELGLDESLVARLEASDGVGAAVPTILSPVEIGDAEVPLLGLDQRAEALGAGFSRQAALASLPPGPGGEPGIVMGQPLARQLRVDRGDVVIVDSGVGTRPAAVAAVLGGQAGQLNDGLFVLAPLPVAQELAAKPDRLDSILVAADEGADLATLERRLGDLVGSLGLVDSPSRPVQEAQRATASMRTGMLLGVSMALAVGAFLVFNTMSMAAAERRRELATLRAVGSPRRRLLTLFLLEAGLVGLVGAALGCVIGAVASRWLVESIPSSVVSGDGLELIFRLPASAIPIAVVSGVAASVLAAFVPARRAVSVPPVESMRPEGALESLDADEGASWGTTAVGVVVAVTGLVAGISGPTWAGITGMVGIFAGVVVASYGLSQPLARSTAAMANRFSVGGRLAGAALERSPRRAWASSVAIIGATAMVVAQSGLFDNLTSSLEARFASLGKVDLYVSSSDATDMGVRRGLPGDWQDDLAAIPGVARVGVNARLFIAYRDKAVVLDGLAGSVGAEPEVAGVSAADRARVEAGQAAIVSTRFSEVFDVERGGTLVLDTPVGPRRLQVVGVVPALAAEGGLVTIGRDALVEWFGHTPVRQYLLSLAAGTDAAAARDAVSRFAAAATPQRVYLNTGAEYVEAIVGAVGQVQALFSGMTAVIIAAAAVAILNALLISVLERRRELGIMRALGTSRRLLRRMVAFEAAALGLVAGIAGAGTGFLLHRAAMAPLLATLREQSGYTITYRIVPGAAVAAVLVGVGIAVVGSVLPARRAARVNVIEAIGYE